MVITEDCLSSYGSSILPRVAKLSLLRSSVMVECDIHFRLWLESTGQGPSLRIIVNSRSKSFERLEQKQGTEMQVYISGESPDGKRNME